MMRLSAMKGRAVTAVLMASLTVAGCGGDDDPDPVEETPAVCSSVDALETSVEDVKSVDLDRDTLPTLETSLGQVQSDLSQVKSDAKDEYATEVDAVEQAASTISSSVQAASDSPSAQTLSAVRTAVQSLGTSLTALRDAVESTC